VIEIQGVAVEADQVQSLLVLTVSVPLAPAAGADAIEFATVTEHLVKLGEVTDIDDDPQAEAKQASAQQSTLATTDERRCRAVMCDAAECKRFA
jgi:hypothetical protein